ncbi:MAG: hypothetical protein ABW060_10995 [Solirubrobacteraceae bacterium]
MRRLLLLAALPLLALLAAPAGAHAELRFCKGMEVPVGDAPVSWKVSKVRLSEGFACEDARRDVRRWIRGGGYMTDKHTLIPWTCEFGNRVRCRLRTSFGGTRPERVYRLRFRLRNA